MRRWDEIRFFLALIRHKIGVGLEDQCCVRGRDVPRPRRMPLAAATNRHFCFVADSAMPARLLLLCWNRSIPNGWVGPHAGRRCRGALTEVPGQTLNTKGPSSKITISRQYSVLPILFCITCLNISVSSGIAFGPLLLTEGKRLEPISEGMINGRFCGKGAALHLQLPLSATVCDFRSLPPRLRA